MRWPYTVTAATITLFEKNRQESPGWIDMWTIVCQCHADFQPLFVCCCHSNLSVLCSVDILGSKYYRGVKNPYCEWSAAINSIWPFYSHIYYYPFHRASEKDFAFNYLLHWIIWSLFFDMSSWHPEITDRNIFGNFFFIYLRKLNMKGYWMTLASDNWMTHSSLSQQPVPVSG